MALQNWMNINDFADIYSNAAYVFYVDNSMSVGTEETSFVINELGISVV